MSFAADWLIHRYQTLTSTMDRAALLAQSGARDRTAVIAAEQTAGRGRGGRQWHSPPGAAIYTTLIVRPTISPARLPILSLITGVAVAEAIEQVTMNPVRLKWPNDVWLGDDPAHQKVAGILLSSKLVGPHIDYALVGIGVNVTAPLDALPPGATSLFAATGRQIDPNALFATLLQRFDAAHAQLLVTHGRPSLNAWRKRAALLGEHVVVEEESGARHGTFFDIAEDGALLLRESESTVRRIVAGDLVRGPRTDQRP